MATERFTEEALLQSRRFSHLSFLRLGLALAYLFVEFGSAGITTFPFSLAAGALFAVYAGVLTLKRPQARIRKATVAIQMVDLLAMILLVLLANAREGALPLLMFYFLLTEASLLNSAREVLIVSTVSVVFYSAWIASIEAGRFQFSYRSFLFMLIVGGVLAYFFSYQRRRAQRRIATRLRGATGGSEAELAAAAEAALKDLSLWLRCSRAVLAFWDSSLDYYAISQYPSPAPSERRPPQKFDEKREWSCFDAERLNFVTNDVSLVDAEGKPLARHFDLHPYAIQRFEIYNAVSCGLYVGEEPVGRLLVVNSVRSVGRSHLKKLEEVAPYFLELALQMLRIRRAEHEAYEKERGRVAHDLHDGPLQSVISFEMRLGIIRRLLERRPEAVEEELGALHGLARKLVEEMRVFVHRMRPLEAPDASLVASIRRLVDSFQKESGVPVTFIGSDETEIILTGRHGTEILQIAREALHNIYKHAQATHVVFSVEKKNGNLFLSVGDNGRGFRFAGQYGLEELDLLRVGPKSIRQRVRALGGELILESHPGQGANLRLTLPL